MRTIEFLAPPWKTSWLAGHFDGGAIAVDNCDLPVLACLRFVRCVCGFEHSSKYAFRATQTRNDFRTKNFLAPELLQALACSKV